ncbi:MAG: hypothetical protein AAGF71_01405 [Pseudomonadota bacterium]
MPTAETVAAQNPQLAKLTAERKALENRMAVLTGGTQGSGSDRDSRRFPVEGIDTRRRAHNAWEADREDNRRSALDQMISQRATTDRIRDRFRQPSDLGQSTPRSGLLDRMGLLPTERDAGARGISGLDGRPRTSQTDTDQDSLDARRDRAVGKLQSLRSMAESVRDKGRDLTRQMDDADRKLAAEGASEADRKALKDAMAPMRGALERADKTMDGPIRKARQAEEAIRKPKAMSNPMDKLFAAKTPEGMFKERTRKATTPKDPREEFEERARRLVQVEQDPFDLERRRTRLHERAMQNRKAREREEAMDEQRRQRAQKKAKQKKAEEGKGR